MFCEPRFFFVVRCVLLGNREIMKNSIWKLWSHPCPLSLASENCKSCWIICKRKFGSMLARINIFKIENEVGMEAVKQYKDAFSLYVKNRVIGTEAVGYSLHVGCLLKRQHKLKSFAEIEKKSQREFPNCITFVQSQALNLILFFLDTKLENSFFTQTVR